MTQVELHDDWHDAYEQGKYRYAEARGMPCGHPHGCVVQDEEGTAHCAWCEEVARLREELEQAEARGATLVKAANALVQRLAALNLQEPEVTALKNAVGELMFLC